MFIRQLALDDLRIVTQYLSLRNVVSYRIAVYLFRYEVSAQKPNSGSFGLFVKIIYLILSFEVID